MTMRVSDGMQEALLTVAEVEDFVPADHLLRPSRLPVNQALGRLGGLFNLATRMRAEPCTALAMLGTLPGTQ